MQFIYIKPISKHGGRLKNYLVRSPNMPFPHDPDPSKLHLCIRIPLQIVRAVPFAGDIAGRDLIEGEFPLAQTPKWSGSGFGCSRVGD